MSSIVVNGDTSGAVTLSAPAVAGTVTVTLPSTTGTMLTTASTAVVTQAMLSTNVAGNGPAFSAGANAATSLIGGTFTKVLFADEEFDTNSNFASSRFTPTVAGYYQINGAVSVSGGAQVCTSIYKNGAEYKRGSNIRASSDGSVSSSIVYCNGSTDYVEIYCFATSTINTNTGIALVWFNGAMIRAA